GRERLAFGKQVTWRSYRALPEHRWDAATMKGDSVYVMGGDHIYRIQPAAAAPVRPLAREGVRLVPLTGSTTSEWMIDLTPLVVPAGATVIGALDDQLLIGTRDLGTAKYR